MYRNDLLLSVEISVYFPEGFVVSIGDEGGSSGGCSDSLNLAVVSFEDHVVGTPRYYGTIVLFCQLLSFI